MGGQDSIVSTEPVLTFSVPQPMAGANHAPVEHAACSHKQHDDAMIGKAQKPAHAEQRIVLSGEAAVVETGAARLGLFWVYFGVFG